MARIKSIQAFKDSEGMLHEFESQARLAQSQINLEKHMEDNQIIPVSHGDTASDLIEWLCNPENFFALAVFMNLTAKDRNLNVFKIGE